MTANGKNINSPIESHMLWNSQDLLRRKDPPDTGKAWLQEAREKQSEREGS